MLPNSRVSCQVLKHRHVNQGTVPLRLSFPISWVNVVGTARVELWGAEGQEVQKWRLCVFPKSTGAPQHSVSLGPGCSKGQEESCTKRSIWSWLCSWALCSLYTRPSEPSWQDANCGGCVWVGLWRGPNCFPPFAILLEAGCCEEITLIPGVFLPQGGICLLP